jgi:hypothetical protein
MVEEGGVAKAVGTGILGTAKSIVISPAFGILVLVGIIGFELWKGKKDAEAMAVQRA